mgnify:CR=1 FL=1
MSKIHEINLACADEIKPFSAYADLDQLIKRCLGERASAFCSSEAVDCARAALDVQQHASLLKLWPDNPRWAVLDFGDKFVTFVRRSCKAFPALWDIMGTEKDAEKLNKLREAYKPIC